jgi:hypothetical protein
VLVAGLSRRREQVRVYGRGGKIPPLSLCCSAWGVLSDRSHVSPCPTLADSLGKNQGGMYLGADDQHYLRE